MVKFKNLLTVTGDCFLLGCDAVYLGQMGTNDLDERAASIFRLGKKMGQHFPYKFTWPDVPEESNLQKHVTSYLYNLPKMLT